MHKMNIKQHVKATINGVEVTEPTYFYIFNEMFDSYPTVTVDFTTKEITKALLTDIRNMYVNGGTSETIIRTWNTMMARSEGATTLADLNINAFYWGDFQNFTALVKAAREQEKHK